MVKKSASLSVPADMKYIYDDIAHYPSFMRGLSKSYHETFKGKNID